MRNSASLNRVLISANHLGVFCVLAVIFGNSILVASAPDKVHVRVYYESLCPDSKAFITKQLLPALSTSNGTLAARVDLELIPFGKAKWTYSQYNTYHFDCHHGPDECTGNLIHACGINKIRVGANVTLHFVACLMDLADRSTLPTTFPVRACATQAGVTNLAEVENCSKHTEGMTYLSNFGQRTESLQPPLSSVPTIVFGDGAVDEAQSAAAKRDFLSAVCAHLRNDPPEQCQLASGALQLSAGLACLLLLLLRLL